MRSLVHEKSRLMRLYTRVYKSESSVFRTLLWFHRLVGYHCLSDYYFVFVDMILAQVGIIIIC